jgi:hypothetical protein
MLPDQPTTIMPNESKSVCFEAKTSGRHVIGLEWTFTIDGEVKVQDDTWVNRNCITVSTTKTTGSVAVQAEAGGQSAAMSLTVGAAPREQLDVTQTQLQKLPAPIPTAGERARM